MTAPWIHRSSMLSVPLCLLVCSACVPPGEDSAAVVYPVLAPRYAYATERHTGESRYGTAGAIMDLTQSAVFAEDGAGMLRFSYAFDDPSTSEEFVGLFLSFGRTAIDVVHPDGTPAPPLNLDSDGTINLNDFMRTRTVDLERLRIAFGAVDAPTPITLKIELKDGAGRMDFVRHAIATDAVIDIPFTAFSGIDRTHVKLISLVIEERHVADKVSNPQSGAVEIQRVELVDADGPGVNANTIRALDTVPMLREIGRRDFESLLRVRDAVTGACLDRTLFRDQIQWGATGWLLAALPAAVDLGWIERAEAEAIATRILSFVDTDALWGDAPTGMIGNSVGIMYRFGGIDAKGLDEPLTGTRKIDPGDVNAVEASVIDTALFQFGAAVCAAGLDGAGGAIDRLAASILGRTGWNALIEPNSGQLYLGWKPEIDLTPDTIFATPASFGGFWASRDAVDRAPLTIDFWTDEGGMAAILATGSLQTQAAIGTWYNMRRLDLNGIVPTFPGAWFTYTFLTAIYLPPALGPDNGAAWNVPSVDWRANAAAVFNRYVAELGAVTLPDAAELPNNAYVAQALPEAAVDQNVEFTGLIAPYSLQLALGLGGDVAADAAARLKKLLETHPELWDPFYGFLDSVHPSLSEFELAADSPGAAPLLRQQGPWIQQQVWPLNKGAGLLALLNYTEDGVIWRLASQYPQITRGLDLIYGRN